MIYVADGVGGGEDQTYFSRLLGINIFNTQSIRQTLSLLSDLPKQAYSDHLNRGKSATTLTAGVIDQTICCHSSMSG